MEFVKVTHKDGRSAEITAGEVAFYRSLGFEPEAGYTPSGDDAEGQARAAKDALLPAASGTDQRLDLVIGELRGLRAAFDRFSEPVEAAELEAIEMPPLEVDFSPVVDELRGLRADLAKASAPAEPETGESVELRGIGSAGTATATTTPEPTTSETSTRRRTSSASD
jgi:hypothetical protein